MVTQLVERCAEPPRRLKVLEAKHRVVALLDCSHDGILPPGGAIWNLAVSETGKIYVPDKPGSRVQVFEWK